MKLPLLALALTSPALADVLNVGGPNADFPEIADAVNAAVDGDVIRVWPGTYAAFAIDDTDLTLVRANDSGPVLVDGTFRVRNLAAGRTVELTGISATGTDGAGAILSNNVGSVRMREAILTGADMTSYVFDGHAGLILDNCADVELAYCTLTGGNPPSGEDGGWGADGLTSGGSSLSAFQTSFTASSGTTDDDPGASGYGGGHGAALYGPGRSWLSGCTFVGGHGGDGDADIDWWTGYVGNGGDGGDGVYMDWTHRGFLLDNDYTAGLGGYAYPGGQPGSDGQEYVGGVLRSGDSKVLRATALTDDQGAIALRFEGTPGDAVYVLAGDDAGFRFHPFRGPSLVSVPVAPLATPWRFMGEIGGSGVLIGSLPIADLPPFEHATVHFQGAFMDGLRNDFGSSSWLVVLDDAW